jgi:hypothetical protein
MSIGKPKAKAPAGATVKYNPPAVIGKATSQPVSDKPAPNIHK